MLLQQLKLNNIRSYVDETITFPEGSTILAGDIGCGKSSILLAIEFALFGTSRPDLPAELLLRKGATQGTVELSFSLNNQEFVIKRSLKKDKTSIKQQAGYIISNGIKKELTPVELKSDIINLLGYPEEFVTKNKNFIFRFTVYTPQEEMKFILQENSEVRLDVLRKIFGIDKYKNIRDNLLTYLKKMRVAMTILTTRIEPLEENQQLFKKLNEDKELTNKQIAEITPSIENIKVTLLSQEEKIKGIEVKQQQFVALKQELETKQALLKEKEQQLFQFQDKELNYKKEISQLDLPGLDLDNIKLELEILEKQKIDIIQKKTTLQEKVNQIQKKIVEERQETSKWEEEVSQINEKESSLKLIQEELSKKEELERKQEELNKLFEELNTNLVRNETTLSQSKGLQQKIGSLEKCPTCLQEVSGEHKHRIQDEENQKIVQAETLLTNLQVKKSELMQQKQQNQNQINHLIKQGTVFVKLEAELGLLRNKNQDLSAKKIKLKELAQENNQLMQQLSETDKQEVVDELQLNISEKKELIQKLTKKTFLNQQLSELIKQKESNVEKISLLKSELVVVNEKLSTVTDNTESILAERKILNEIKEKDKELQVVMAQHKTSLNNFISRIEEVQKIINKLSEEKDKLTQHREIYHWLNAYLFPLTYTIEKQVMINIYHLFNQLFQEWFSILIEDETIYGRIDDSFSPVIEQNGYEISFNNLSGGEKTSAALAYRLALNRVINDVVHQIKTKDLLILDEPTDGFSSQQLDKVRDVLERLNLRQTIIVSHESKIESFVDNVVRVRKEGHVSNVYS